MRHQCQDFASRLIHQHLQIQRLAHGPWIALFEDHATRVDIVVDDDLKVW
jgi:hypothetical protein